MRPNPFSIAGSLGCYVWLGKKEQKSFHTVATVFYFRLRRSCLRFHCFVKCLFYSADLFTTFKPSQTCGFHSIELV